MVIHNPVIWADVPDNDVIRVKDCFYMVSTSMHTIADFEYFRFQPD